MIISHENVGGAFMPKNTLLIPVMLLVFYLSIFAQETAVPFLLTEPTAKANGMAGSYTAIANDGNAMFYNPAGLLRMTYGSFEYGYYNLYPRSDILTDFWIRYYAATTHIPSLGAWGISFSYYSLGGESVATDENGNLIDTYYPHEWVLALGYARYIGTKSSLGASFKLIKQNWGPNSLSIGSATKDLNSTAFAFDFGLLYTNFLPELNYTRRYLKNNLIKWSIHRPPPGPSIGLAVRNIGPEMDYVDQTLPLPQQLRIGMAWNTIDTDILGLIFSTDLRKMLVHGHDNFLASIITSWEKFSFNQMEVSYGLELSLLTVISFRFGKFIEDKYTGLYNYNTYGISIGPESFRINWYLKRYYPKPRYSYDDNYWRIGFSAAY
jgi:hypothetical protein